MDHLLLWPNPVICILTLPVAADVIEFIWFHGERDEDASNPALEMLWVLAVSKQ